jgi:hypothetical protein
MWLAAEPFHDGLSEARLADTGFARDRHHATVAPLCPFPPSQEQIDLLVAALKSRHRASLSPSRRPLPHGLCLKKRAMTTMRARQDARGVT